VEPYGHVFVSVLDFWNVHDSLMDAVHYDADRVMLRQIAVPLTHVLDDRRDDEDETAQIDQMVQQK
jgi:hypothetical protein